jgi:hypothetical protein
MAPSRAFLIASGLLAVGIVGLSMHAASQEWFSRDDFAFLTHVQSADPWSWRRVFLPLEERFWPFYRPLGMETYFYVGFQLFGLNAFGYFALSLGVHFASGVLLFRIARQLDFDVRVAVMTALLLVSRDPALSEIFYGSVFHYALSVFLTLLSVSCFLEHLAAGRLRWQLASCVALLLALLCNEVNALAPVWLVLAGLAAGPERFEATGRLLRSAAPQALLVGLFLGFRFLLLAPVEAPAIYTPRLGLHVAHNAVVDLLHLFGGAAGSAVMLGLALLLVSALVASPRGRPQVPGLARRGLSLLVWMGLAIAPFALLPFPQARYAWIAAAPVCLLLGALLDASWRAWGREASPVFEAALLVLALVSVPYGELYSHVTDPVGGRPRRIIEWIDAQEPPVPRRAVLVILYGAPGLADAEAAERFRYLVYGGGVLRAAYPHMLRVMRFHDLTQRPPRNMVRPDSIYLVLRSDLSVEAADGDLLDRELPRRFSAPPRSSGFPPSGSVP